MSYGKALKACPVCGKRVKDLSGHAYRIHGVPGAGRFDPYWKKGEREAHIKKHAKTPTRMKREKQAAKIRQKKGVIAVGRTGKGTKVRTYHAGGTIREEVRTPKGWEPAKYNPKTGRTEAIR